MNRLVLIILGGVLLGGCETLGYLGQAAAGQWSIWAGRREIETLLTDPATDPALQSRLSHVLAIREYASAKLGLPDNDSYRYYTPLPRTHVAWNVFAAETFSVEPLTWCFPIAGCVSYRGYFQRQDATQFAAKLHARGYDTYVAPVAAYSTLGWFDDPVLSTFVFYEEPRLAGLIFHELAHQQVYVPGDTAFNESFATTVEIEGLRRWLQHRGRAEQMQAVRREQRMQRDFANTLLRLREQLRALYAEPLPPEQMRRRKRETIAAFVREDYAAFKRRWSGSERYDSWVQSGLNNARLVTVANYNRWVAAFQTLLDQQQGDLQSFYRRVAELAENDAATRHRMLQQLAE